MRETQTISRSEIYLILMASGVKFEDLQNSQVWALGSDQLEIKEWKDSWNEKHKELFEITGDQTVFHCIFRMGEEYSKIHYKEE